ncbi:MAG: type VII secretion protein EccB [Actinobacteria bacterium 13_2_20CM_2_71_6]|nr:MAG: type VII secretion protein EccB [Actinobacteria bacterium 13_2_20CM_2_71_6]
MASRRDQLHSYQFLTQRVLSYGILTKAGSNNWHTDGAVIVEKESGASYVYFDGRLHPALNYASALLAAQHNTPAVFRVPAKSLAGIRRDVTIGIPGAPNSLPAGNRTVGLPWTLCSSPGDATTSGPVVTMAIGQAPGGAAHELGEDEGLLVTDSKVRYLVWKSHRYRIRQDTVVTALFADATANPVGLAWLNALPPGVDIDPIEVTPGSSVIPGHKAGDLLVANTESRPLYYLVLADGVVRLTALQRSLYLDAPATATQITVAQANGLKASADLQPPTDESQAPPQAPKLAAKGGEGICAVTRDTRSASTVWVGGTLDVSGATTTPSRSSTGTPLANQVLMPMGHVAVVRTMASPTAPAGGYVLVTDVGVQYAVPSDFALQSLGFQPAQAVPVPASLVAQLPAGPMLDNEAARRPAPLAGTGN